MNPYEDRLRKRVDANRASRQRDLERTQAYRDRMREIADAYPRVLTQFWCDTCSLDVEGMGVKQVRGPQGRLPWAWYEGRCAKNHVVLRRITEKQGDPYYVRSEKLKRERIDMADAMLQPHEPRFRLVYPDQWKAIQAQSEADREARDLSEKQHA